MKINSFRPEDPIKFIATYMLENNPNRRWFFLLTLLI